MGLENQGTDGTASSIPEFYTNSILVNISSFELELQSLLVDSQQNIKGAVNIRMSPQTAWTLSKALAKHLALYDEKFGKKYFQMK